MPFTENEVVYLKSQALGRLATVGRNSEPHNVPVGFRYNTQLRTIDLVGRDMGRSQKYRNIQRNSLVAFVVDDIVDADTWTVRGIEIRGIAQALPCGGKEIAPHAAHQMIRIKPTRIVAWGIDQPCQAGYHARDVAANVSQKGSPS
jgi:pyridoxamine 5'-phosphate oxidase family protein